MTAPTLFDKMRDTRTGKVVRFIRWKTCFGQRMAMVKQPGYKFAKYIPEADVVKVKSVLARKA